jgi:AcrR family transcriptional regulator
MTRMIRAVSRARTAGTARASRPVLARRTAKRRIQPEVARARILEAARSEFAKHGFVAASTNAIAQVAGVAKGLVFHHFESKLALYLAVVDRVGDRIVDEFLQRTDWPTDLF